MKEIEECRHVQEIMVDQETMIHKRVVETVPFKSITEEFNLVIDFLYLKEENVKKVPENIIQDL